MAFLPGSSSPPCLACTTPNGFARSPSGSPEATARAVTGVCARFRRAYGAEPLHLLVAVATLALAGYGLVSAAARPDRVAFALWFGGAIVAHDLVLFWLYAAVRRGLERSARRLGHDRPERALRAINHVTVPAFVSALLLLVWLPLIAGWSAPV